MFSRALSTHLKKAAQSFYALSLVGPRQSGKTTLLRYLFPTHIYLNLEDLDTRDKLSSDPSGFFADSRKKWIIDEAQEYPELFSYLLSIIDNNKVHGQFILSGSQNFLLMEQISQSLAGRIAVLELLPLTYGELKTYGKYADQNIWDLVYQGSYPGTYANNVPTDVWYKSYITTYLQRDIRQLLNVKDLMKFHLFLRLCAGRHGQLINQSEIGAACGVSHTTILEWINLLEVSYIIFRLPPFYKNYDKRLVKKSKLYFFDSGLVCHLLGIESAQHAELHASRGALFEGYVISEVYKSIVANAKTPNLYFWNAHKSFEVDLLVEQAGNIKAVEIKSGSTFSSDYLTQIKKWQSLTKDQDVSRGFVVYTGKETFINTDINVLSYMQLDLL